MLFSSSFSRAWHLVWGNRWMLLLGLVAALGSCNAGGTGSPGVSLEGVRFTNSSMLSLATTLTVMGVVALIFLVVMWCLRVVAQVALIRATVRLDQEQSMTLGEAWHLGRVDFWPVVKLNLVLFGVLVGIVMLALLLLAFFGYSGLTGVGGGITEPILASGIILPLVCLLLAAVGSGWLLAVIIYPFALRAMLLEGFDLRTSLLRGIYLVRRFFSSVMLLVIFFGVLWLLAYVAAGAFSFPMAPIAAGPILFRAFAEQSLPLNEALLIMASSFMFLLVAAVVNAFFVAWRSAIVTLVYQDMVEYE